MRAGTLILAFALAAVLAACNGVYSERPLFDAADAGTAAPLRTGLWLLEDPGCPFDTTAQVRSWPKCARWMVVRPAQLRALDGSKKGWVAADYVLAGGSPQVLQLALPAASGQGRDYYYLGLEPLQLDPDDSVIEYREWLAQCGPPSPPPAPAKGRKHKPAQSPAGALTHAPLPGLQPAPDALHADDCRAADKAAVRAAVETGRAWTGTQLWRWIRGGES